MICNIWKLNIDTRNDGLDKVNPFKHMVIFGYFQGCMLITHFNPGYIFCIYISGAEEPWLMFFQLWR